MSQKNDQTAKKALHIQFYQIKAKKINRARKQTKAYQIQVVTTIIIQTVQMLQQ